MNQIVSDLRRCREAAGLTITEVARRMGTDRARISEIEHGRGGLTLKRMLAYADAIGVKVTIKFE